MKKRNFKEELDLQNYKNEVLTIEDRILKTLYKEKGSTKGEISNITNIDYSIIRNKINEMEEYELVVARKSFNNLIIYYLTQEGVYQTQDRFNNEIFKKYHALLLNLGYEYEDVSYFLKQKFFLYYLSGNWNPNTLVEEFKKWQEIHGSNNTNNAVKSLKLN